MMLDFSQKVGEQELAVGLTWDVLTATAVRFTVSTLFRLFCPLQHAQHVQWMDPQPRIGFDFQLV